MVEENQRNFEEVIKASEAFYKVCFSDNLTTLRVH